MRLTGIVETEERIPFVFVSKLRKMQELREQIQEA